MCTYLYAAFSLKDGEAEGLSAEEAEAVKRWRRAIIDVAIDEMGHLVAVWNITAGVAGQPRFGRENFPLDPGLLPAGVVVKLAPFNEQTLQHFVHLERPKESLEPDGADYSQRDFKRGAVRPRLTPMAIDYDTVGEFYDTMEMALAFMAKRLGEKELFCGDPALQLSANESRSRRRQTSALQQNRNRRLPGHHYRGRGRVCRESEFPFLPLPRHSRRIPSAESQEPELRPRPSGGGESSAAPPDGGRARVAGG